MKFLQNRGYEIMKLIQLESTQSEIENFGYEINKSTGSAEFPDSGSSNVSFITHRIYIGWC
jgi:hypothetical protein